MNFGFRFVIWNPVYHNNKFSHNTERVGTIVAESIEEAIKAIEPTLELSKTYQVHEGLRVETKGEYIHSIVELGKARKITKWVFEKEGYR